jgi:hypothetical protein
MTEPNLVSSLLNLRPEEIKCIGELQAALSDNNRVSRVYSTHEWLKLAWSRHLDHQRGIETIKNHLNYIENFKIDQIPMRQVEENFTAGFSVRAGRDFDGRPMLWQRMKFMTPASIPLAVGIKSTWLALDAALADVDSNRSGLCLVYDFTGVGMRNITLNMFDVRDGALACGAAHPSHIARVVFLNPPAVFKLGYQAARPLLPASVTRVVTMMDTKSPNWFESVCTRSQLPEYLGGEQRGDYFSWLIHRLDGSHLLYR